MTVEYPALWTSVSHLSITGLRGHCGREDGETVGVRVLGAVLWSETVSSRHDKTWWTHRSCGCMHKTCTRVSRSIFQCGQDTGSRGQVSSWGDIAISWLLDKDSQFFFQELWPLACGCPHSSVYKLHTHMYTSSTNWIQKVTKRRACEGNAVKVRKKSRRVEIVKYTVNIYLSLSLSFCVCVCTILLSKDVLWVHSPIRMYGDSHCHRVKQPPLQGHIELSTTWFSFSHWSHQILPNILKTWGSCVSSVS